MNKPASPSLSAPVAKPRAAEKPIKVEHPTVEALRMFMRNPSAIIGSVLLGLIVLISIFGPSPDFRDVISVTIMQFAWIAISVYGMWRGIKSRAASFRNRKGPPPAV